MERRKEKVEIEETRKGRKTEEGKGEYGMSEVRLVVTQSHKQQVSDPMDGARACTAVLPVNRDGSNFARAW